MMTFSRKKLVAFLIIIIAPIILAFLHYSLSSNIKITFKVFDWSHTNSFASLFSQSSYAKSYNFFKLQESLKQEYINLSYDFHSGSFDIEYSIKKYSDAEFIKNNVKDKYLENYNKYAENILDTMKNYHNKFIASHPKEISPYIFIDENIFLEFIVFLKMNDFPNAANHFSQQFEFDFSSPVKKLSFFILYLGYLNFIITILISIFLISKVINKK